MSSTQTTPPRKRAPRRAAPGLNFQKPVPAPPLRQVNGLDVVNIVRFESLPGKPMRMNLIKLEDGSQLFGCYDCPDVLDFTGSRGEVMAHRNALHGAMFGKRKPKVVPDPSSQMDVLDIVVESRGPDQPAPQTPYDMTVRELLAIMPSVAALGDLIDRTEAERDALLAELNAYRAHDRENKAKIEGFDALRDEVIELRVQMRQWGNYEAVKAEMYALRGWKRKIITKFKALGFQFDEEDK